MSVLRKDSGESTSKVAKDRVHKAEVSNSINVPEMRTFGKTSVHIGAEQAQNMTAEYEDECKLHNEQIAAVEKALKAEGEKN